MVRAPQLVRVLWTQRAEDDVLRHWLFLAERNVGHAQRVEARLRAAADLIGGVPLIGRRVVRTTRDLSLPDIQYVMRYRVDEDAIRILEICHTRQNREAP